MSSLNLKIPPVAQGIIALALMGFLDRYAPVYRIEIIFKEVVASAVAAIGGVVALAAVLTFIKLRTTVDPRCPDDARTLVLIGVYKYSRNPMYLGVLLVLGGFGIYLGALSSSMVVFAFMIYIRRYQIKPEEQSLEQKFGEQYRQYAQKVRRWL